jgi:K+-sensing histidine kinase KdpD
VKARQRILLSFTPGRRGETSLRRAGEIAASEHADLLVVQVLDTRSGFEPDGPAAILPGEHAARRVPAEKKRLDQQLTQNGLGWAKTAVVCGEPRAVLSEMVRSWRPDLVISDARMPRILPRRAGQNEPEMMTVGGGGLFARMAEFLFPHARGHA